MYALVTLGDSLTLLCGLYRPTRVYVSIYSWSFSGSPSFTFFGIVIKKVNQCIKVQKVRSKGRGRENRTLPSPPPLPPSRLFLFECLPRSLDKTYHIHNRRNKKEISTNFLAMCGNFLFHTPAKHFRE